ncbi:hypothetical protein NC653_037429 [Populus alba x Populus x berolinensis]|uniref:Uncharacterized protein n=1 Tax=Populus alba x Populus x berolinensis TaxID=444605 RepID=A0AAD6PS26_9ROSI|nr:hypothetical protein NC653_037429 [Populus alba x Populus x berolinensis]
MENDIEQARASNMEEDKATTPNKGKDIDVVSASDIEMVTNKKIEREKATDILEKLDSEEKQMSFKRYGSERCIYRVPQPLRNVNGKAYSPILISIGPLNRQNTRPEAMEKLKLKYFKKLTERVGMDKKKNILISIENQEERLRHCYSGKFKSIKSRDFVEMILLDAVFIIQFLLESKDHDNGPENFEPRMTFDIRQDLVLLENQLPFFIIQEIYDQVDPPSQDATAIPFLDLAKYHFRKYKFSQGAETSPIVKESRHFTDLLRNLMLNGAIPRSYKIYPMKLKYSAVMLREAGVKFQVTEDKCPVNIEFEEGVLKIPQLEVDHSFERLVRNIMALEQCCYPSEAYVCSYIKFMDHLINSAEDVGLLVRKGIILNGLGDDAAVSNLINHFCENINDSYTCFGDISQVINAHYESRFNHIKATLKLIYFPNIWRGTATVAAAILLILTLIQTIASVKSAF